MKIFASVAALIAGLLFAGAAEAQSFVIGVTACGTAPSTIVNGRPAYLTVDLNGVLCQAASGGGSPSNVNVAQINGVTPLMGNGVTGTGSPRVTIASDNTPFSVNATLSAETTKVIGTVNQGTSPWVTSATQSGTWNINNVSGTISLPTGAATSAAQTTMATNQTGGGQKTQIVDGSGNVISATANALDINIKSGSAAVAASENHIGEVGGNILPITNAMTTSNATVTTGQSIGGIQTLANAVRVSGSLGASGTSGIIQSVVITFLDAVATSEIDVYFYNATVTTGSNCQNATPFVLQTADRTNVLGIAKVTDFTSSNTAVVAQANNLAIPFGLASSTSLFACLVARGSFAITGTANASIKVNVLRN